MVLQSEPEGDIRVVMERCWNKQKKGSAGEYGYDYGEKWSGCKMSVDERQF